MGVRRSCGHGRVGRPGAGFAGLVRRPGALGFAGLVVVASTACTAKTPSILDARSPGPAKVEGLWWLMLAMSAVVILLVVGMIVFAVARRHRRTEEEARAPAPWGEPFIIVAGLVVSGVALTAVFVISLLTMRAVAESGRDAELTIEVIGHDWWWEVRYPNGAVTANEIHIPAGEPVRLRLTTADVIHSFWVPQLGSKTDMIPGKVNEAIIEADEPGRFWGQCAEFCGLQHAKMIVHVVAQTSETFRTWVADQRASAAEPATPDAVRGREVFLTSTCAGCHTIRGTPADGNAGPDLTHLASRSTIGSGIVENEPANLTRWILDPQSLKPGVTMPPTELGRADLEALLAYLTQLR